MRRTKIVCTIGPASRSPEMLRALIRAGMDVARLNFSFGDHQVHRENVQRIRSAAAAEGKPVGILMDLQGPKLRVGQLPADGVSLHSGQEITLTTRPTLHVGEIPVQYEDLPRVVQAGHRILIDDGLIELRAIETSDTDIRCQVVTGGLLVSNKGLNLPRAPLTIAAITDKDKADLAFALEQQADWIALSFVRTADEVREIAELIRVQSAYGRPAPVVAKIEKPEAVDNIDAIIQASDAIMVARGDLGIEASPEEVPLLQKMIIAKSNLMGRPVITATQMLDSMIRNPRPTRAEASDVANAILDGTDAIMLSGETAVGKYPIETVETMARIAEYTERGGEANAWSLPASPSRGRGIAEAVARASCDTAQDLGATAIITPTSSGRTARLVSMFRPRAPIVAVTPSPMVQRQLSLLWGVNPLMAPRSESTDRLIDQALQAARVHGFAKPGDLVVVTAGAPSGGLSAIPTDLMKVQRIECVLAKGMGIGTRVIQGRARILPSPPESLTRIAPDEIIVALRTDRSFVDLVQHAAGLIVEESDLSSHAANLAVELGIPTIMGVQAATEIIQDRQELTIDPSTGRVYLGYVRPGKQ